MLPGCVKRKEEKSVFKVILTSTKVISEKQCETTNQTVAQSLRQQTFQEALWAAASCPVLAHQDVPVLFQLI